MIKKKNIESVTVDDNRDVSSNLLNKRLSSVKIEAAINEKINKALSGEIKEDDLSDEEKMALIENKAALERKKIEESKRQAELLLEQQKNEMLRQAEEAQKALEEEKAKIEEQKNSMQNNIAPVTVTENSIPQMQQIIPSNVTGGSPINVVLNLPSTYPFPNAETNYFPPSISSPAAEKVKEEEIFKQKYNEHLEAIESMKKKSPDKFSKFMRFMFYIFIFLIFSYSIKTFVVASVKVDGISMMPTYADKEFVLMDRITYKFADGKVDDVIIIKAKNGNPLLIKRVVALPGDRVKIFNGYLYVNDEKIESPFAEMVDPGIANVEIQLGDDEYFVLGDNRNVSKDSRTADVGPIKRDEIIGKVVTKTPELIAKIFATRIK